MQKFQRAVIGAAKREKIDIRGAAAPLNRGAQKFLTGDVLREAGDYNSKERTLSSEEAKIARGYYATGQVNVDEEYEARLTQLFETAQSVTGTFGLIVFSAFTVLSALTTILGSYYYMTKLFKNNPINRNIAIYLTLVAAAGTLAVFGANVVFEAVDLLLFVLCGINVTALMIFTFTEWKNYIINDNDDFDSLDRKAS